MSTRYRTLLQFTGAGYSNELKAIIARANLEGFTLPDEATLIALDIFILAMKACGYWDKRDLILNFCYNNVTCRAFSMINMRYPNGTLATENNTYYNILSRSEEFDGSIWGKVSCTILANDTTAPDGTLTADKITTTAATVRVQINNPITNTILLGKKYNLSVYAKAGTRDIILLRDQLNTPNGASFNLTTGVATTTGNGINAIMTLEANGFYRCSVDFTPATTNLNFAPSGGVALGDIWLWGAQLTEDYGLLPYQKTELSSYGRIQYDTLGFLGSPSSAPIPFIDTNFNPSIGINQYSLNNASRDFILNNTFVNNHIDSSIGGFNNCIRLNSNPNRINSSTNGVSNLFPNTIGYKALNRINSTQIVSVNNAVAVTNTLNSVSINNGNQYLFSSNFGGSTAHLGYYSMGAEVVTEGQLFRVAYNNYLTAIGLPPIA